MGICMTMSYAHLSLLTASSVRREELGLFCFLSERRWFSPKERKESEVTQLCPTLCDPMVCSLLGSSVHGIFQARLLEWIAIFFSRGSYQSGDQTPVSLIVGRHFTI